MVLEISIMKTLKELSDSGFTEISSDAVWGRRIGGEILICLLDENGEIDSYVPHNFNCWVLDDYDNIIFSNGDDGFWLSKDELQYVKLFHRQ